MKKILNATILLLLLSFSSVQGADWVNWSNFSKVTGMVQQGSKLWISGHGGVMTVDTVTQQKTYYIKTQGQLPSLMVEDIAIDPATSDIWIGTYDNGLVQVHNGQWIVQPYPANVLLYHIAIDAQGTIWCATDGGLYKYANNTYTHINSSNLIVCWDVKIFPNGKLLLASLQPVIYDPVLDSATEIHTTVATYNTSYIYLENDSSYYFTAQPWGISHMIDTTEYYITDSQTVAADDQVVQMKVVNGDLMALTMNNHLYQYSGSWTQPLDADAEAVKATLIYQDVNAKLWLGGIANGGTIRPLNGGADISIKKFALQSNLVGAIHDKSSTEMWVLAGNEIGVYDKPSTSFSQVYELPVANYNNLFNVGDITIWNGTPIALTDSGLFKFTGSAWTPFFLTGMPNINYMLCLASDTSGNMYIGTLNGIYIVNGNTVTAYTGTNTPAIGSNGVVRKAYFDQSRNIVWFGLTDRIVKYQNGSFAYINSTNTPQLGSYNYIGSIAQDSVGDMWFGTAYGGLIKYDGTNYTIDSVQTSAGNQIIMAIAFDGSTMYVGDNVYGFWVRDNGVWTNYSAENSDLTSDYSIGLYVDDRHDVWINAMDDGNLEAFGIDIFNKTQVTLSVPETSLSAAIHAYPNPAGNLLYILSDQIDDGDMLKVTDMTGRDCGGYVVSHQTIDISTLDAGIYLIGNEKIHAIRIVKE